MTGSLVIGASGLVGQHLHKALEQRGFPALGTCWNNPAPLLRPLDIRDRDAVHQLAAQIKPETIFLPASLTNVDYCESHPTEGYQVNVIGVKNSVEVANRWKAKIVYFSSDYIFDGTSGPYRETDPGNPICEYGRQKLIAEHCVATSAQNYLIIRTTVVFGWERQGKNFVMRLLQVLREGNQINVPVDQIGSPTYAPDLAQTVVSLVEQGASGVYNVVGVDQVSRYDFACEVARIFGHDSQLVKGVTTDILGQLAPRPRLAGLRVDKMTERLGRAPVGYEEGLCDLRVVVLKEGN